ncbi:LacI family DNA-binding transcriptional regulator [Aestuariivirga litoralis]|uniref:LacI family DNA-binding transcriptional regulator n=1 Tax=Aestuariivirga litoralis TaxID=2650924 RepID=UPI0018C52FB5|nr:LacI family DNA-binding transcriptional regulator [Aestuariivirga litoralis]
MAKKAGVSVATVDRVLNRRLPVRADTAQRVVQAAEAIGYHATGLLKRRLTEAPVRKFGFLLQKRDAFYQVLGRELADVTKLASYIEGKPIVEFMEELAPGYIASKIREVAPKVDAMAVVAVDHPLINEAVDTVVQSGKPVFSLLSDLTTEMKSGHIGMDGRKVGRIAAWTISRMAKRQGQVGILLGSHRYLNQDLAEISFRSYMREHAPHFTVLEAIINLDDEHIAYDAISHMVEKSADLVAIYACGGGQDGLIKALRDKRGDRNIVAICNELTQMTRTALIDGTIDLCLGHPVVPMASLLVEMMAKACSAPEIPHFPPRLFSAEIFISENI